VRKRGVVRAQDEGMLVWETREREKKREDERPGSKDRNNQDTVPLFQRGFKRPLVLVFVLAIRGHNQLETRIG
jgi:hypothetical protein